MGDRPKPGYAYVGPVALPEELVQRFWARVNLAGPPPPLRPDLGPCWLWRGVPDKDGYGRIHVRGDTVAPYAAHRVAWAIHFGRWPDPMALHRCDVRPCVRWEHLYEGSKADNATDRDFGRHFRSLRAGACRRGHEMTTENTRVVRLPDGATRALCVTCAVDREAARLYGMALEAKPRRRTA